MKNKSDLLIDQLRAIDNKRLIKGSLLKCPATLMARIDQCIIEALGLYP
ncbi:hypothetical protein ACFLZ5_08005 [Thermodesulfobacteriota bacterium]